MKTWQFWLVNQLKINDFKHLAKSQKNGLTNPMAILVAGCQGLHNMGAQVTKAELMELPREALADEALRMRRRAQTVKSNGDTLMGNVRDGLVGGATAWGLGWFMGTRQLEYDKLVAEKGEEAAKAEDPRVIIGVPIDALVAGGLWVLGLGGWFGKRLSPYFLAAGQGGLHGFLYGWGQEVGLMPDDEEDEEDEAA
jgi:hypothetical protein